MWIRKANGAIDIAPVATPQMAEMPGPVHKCCRCMSLSVVVALTPLSGLPGNSKDLDPMSSVISEVVASQLA